MRKLIALAASIGLVAILAGCAMPMNGPVYGGIFGKVRGPQSLGDTAVSQAKTGSAESKSIVGVAMGDSSIAAAMKDGNITKVHHVDTETFNVLGVYATSKTIVYGE